MEVRHIITMPSDAPVSLGSPSSALKRGRTAFFAGRRGTSYCSGMERLCRTKALKGLPICRIGKDHEELRRIWLVRKTMADARFRRTCRRNARSPIQSIRCASCASRSTPAARDIRLRCLPDYVEGIHRRKTVDHLPVEAMSMRGHRGILVG